jgi:hypothetical protein
MGSMSEQMTTESIQLLTCHGISDIYVQHAAYEFAWTFEAHEADDGTRLRLRRSMAWLMLGNP